MQAAQSNTASDRTKPFPGPAPLEPDAHPGAGREAPVSTHLFSASPILSPISAARRYLERQRGDGPERQRGGSQERQRGSQERQRGDARQGSASGEGAARLPVRDSQVRDSESRDRRLERSLYEALAEEDATESPAAYPISYPAARPITRSMEGGGEAALDPERVRGAISRLARSAEGSRPEAGWAAARARLTPPPVGLRPQQTSAPKAMPETTMPETAVPETTVPGGAWPQTAESETGVKPTDITKIKTAETPPMAFAEVARRLWGAGMEISEPPESSEADPVSPAQPPIGRIEAGREAFRARGAERESQTPEPRGPLQGVAEEPLPSAVAAIAGNAAAEAEDAKAARSLVENAPALAHDACNLLSALGLYGELLAFPGVLGREHRHYAEELKLLAARSEVLIGRLLRTAEPEEKAAAGDNATAQDVKKAGYQAEESRVEARVEAQVQPPFAAQAASSEAMGPGALAVDTAAPQPVSLRPGAASASAAADPQATNLVDLLMRWGSLLSTLAHGTLEVSFGPGAATPVPAAAEPLERILVNLVRNARAATTGGGAIRIGVGRRETEPEAVVLTVDDSGCGMDEAQVRSILAGETAASPRLEGERDGAGVPTVPAAGGRRRRGLGLQIVRELVAASGGALSIQSRPGTGTRIEIRWPVAQAAAAPRAAAGDQPDTAVASGASAETAAAGDAAERDGPTGAGAGGIPRPVFILPEGTPRTEGAFRMEGVSRIEGASRGEQAVPPGSAPGSASGSASGVRDAGAAPVRMPEPVGPDGFNEEQLRGMMLRLHRSAPGERIRAGAPWTSQATLQGPLQGPLQVSAPGPARGSARGGHAPAGGAAATGVLRDGPGTEGAGADRDSGDDSALKGAIAC